MRTPLRMLVVLVGAAACGGGDTAADTANTPPATTTPPPAAGMLTPDAITPQMVALGDSVFKGTAGGGICYTCHGPDAKGTELAPNLTDSVWLNGDGTLPFVVRTVANGVPTPVQHPAPMPPFGAMLTPDHARAVAAYVYSLTHPVGGG